MVKRVVMKTFFRRADCMLQYHQSYHHTMSNEWTMNANNYGYVGALNSSSSSRPYLRCRLQRIKHGISAHKDHRQELYRTSMSFATTYPLAPYYCSNRVIIHG
jgi:hypothetical protein